MADQQHPMALRPGGTSPSPDPIQQQQRQSVGAPLSRPDSNPQQQQPPPNQAVPFSRFASGQYGQSPTGEKPTSPVSFGSQMGNPFTEHGRRSRSSTVGQGYPVAVGEAQPLMAQHSGYQGASHQSSSRPVSRSAGQSPASAASNYPLPTGASRPTSSRSPFSSPVSAPPRQHPYQILLINPNSTRAMTEACLNSVRPTLPTGVELTGYTAPYPAPTAIESMTDAIMSTEAVLRDLAKYAASNGETVQNFDGMIVACYSKHPLVEALRESYDVPIIGIMEASLYIARMLGGRFGIVAAGSRSKLRQEDAVAAYGLSHFYVGSEAMHLGVLELESRAMDEVAKRVAHCSRTLANRGADTILLGCAGMTEMVRAAKDGVRDEDGRRTVNVVEGVEAGVQMMCTLVGMGVPTSKKGIYRSEREGRRTRGQNWL